MRRTRRSVLSAAALGLALAATGCTYMSPVQTKDFYQAADGTNANIQAEDGALFAGVRNAVLVIGEDGTPKFSASVASYASEEITVSLEGVADGSTLFSTEVQVPAHGVVELGPGEGRQPVQISAADVRPGTILDLEVTADGQTTTISVPAIDETLDYYQIEDPAAG